jgi:hypothetical protein
MYIKIIVKKVIDLTPWSTALHEEPKSRQPVTNFQVFDGTSRFITTFIYPHHMSLS